MASSAGKPHGILPYGLEALGLLRIEKGHIAGPELNGQTTAKDLGFEKMMKKKGDFIGRVSAERPALVSPDRPRLVGIRAVDPSFEKRLRGGAHLVEKPDSKKSLGWATSITRSVELERWLGLAMIRQGPERIGQRPYAAYPLVVEATERVRADALGTIRKVIVEYTQGWLAEPIENSGQKQALWRLNWAQHFYAVKSLVPLVHIRSIY